MLPRDSHRFENKRLLVRQNQQDYSKYNIISLVKITPCSWICHKKTGLLQNCRYHKQENLTIGKIGLSSFTMINNAKKKRTGPLMPVSDIFIYPKNTTNQPWNRFKNKKLLVRLNQ